MLGSNTIINLPSRRSKWIQQRTKPSTLEHLSWVQCLVALQQLCKQGDNSHPSPSYREFSLASEFFAAFSKMNHAGRTWAQILMLSFRKHPHSHLSSLRLGGPPLTPCLEIQGLKWRASFPVKPWSERQDVLVTWANAFKWSLSATGGNYWFWKHWPHYWEITYILSKDFPIHRWKALYILINPSATHCWPFSLNSQIPCAIHTNTWFIISFQVNYLIFFCSSKFALLFS